MSFWTNDDGKRLVRKFCDKYACLAKERPELRQNHARIMEKLFERLKSENQCIRIDFTGSAYTGLEIGPDREFDVQFVCSGNGLKMERSEKWGENFHIEATSSYQQHRDCLTLHQNVPYLDPKKLHTKFYNLFDKAQDVCKELGIGYLVKQQLHDSAIQWDIYEKTTREFLYSVDLVPSIEEDGIVEGGKHPRQFVANLDGQGLKAASKKNYRWRQSDSVDEYDILKTISKGDLCHKQVIRTMKALIKPRDTHNGGWAALPGFRSYHIYTALLHEHERLSHPAHWTQDRLAERLRDTLAYWRDCMAARCLGHPFLPHVNLITKWTPGHCDNNCRRLNRILSKRGVFETLLLH